MNTFEALDAAVEAFFQLYEQPGLIDIDPLERFGPYLEPIETLNSARIQADYGQELAAAHQAVEEYWEQWQADARPAIQDFIRLVEREWLRTYPATDLLHKQFPERRWIIPNLMSEGLIVMAGKSGMGKSWWALQLAIAIAQGGKAFDAFEVTQGDVLYLSLEDDAQHMQERLQACLEEGEAWPTRLTIAHEAPLLSNNLSQRLEAWVKAQEAPRLIIIDVLEKIRPRRDPKGDIYQQDYAISEALKPLARRYHIAIVILHHCNKLVRPEDPLDAISGSTGLIAPADIKAVFTRGRGEADAKLFVTGRSVREQWAAFKFDEGYWSYLGDAHQAEASEARRAIMAVLDHAEGPMTPKAMAQQTGKPLGLIYFLLNRMVHADQVKRIQRGWYTLPPPQFPAKDAKDTKDTKDAKDAKEGDSAASTPPILSASLAILSGPAKDVSQEKTNENSTSLASLAPIVGRERNGEGSSTMTGDASAEDHTAVHSTDKKPYGKERCGWIYSVRGTG